MNQLANEIALNIKRHRKQLGLSSAQVSLKAGFSRSYVNKVENDGVRITVEKLYMLARILECNVSDLLPEDRHDLLD
ncbi:helix-turn-helix domain-containing protein [Vibrio splendidus]